MCGIVGFISSEGFVKSLEREKWFSQALFTNTLRGGDSTGMFFVDNKSGKVGTFKKALHAPDFLDLGKVNTIINKSQNYSIIIGHNRAATKGSITSKNAHPFKHDGITCVHNGTIYNHRSLKGCSNFDVDSEAITWSIANNGIDYTIKNINGAYALVYFDENKQKLYILRNDERPLAVGFVKDNDTMLIASEAKMLQWIADRNSIALEKTVCPKSGVLYEMDTSDGVRKFKERKVEMYKVKTYSYNDDWYGRNKSAFNNSKGKVTDMGQNLLLSKLGITVGSNILFRVTKVKDSQTGTGNIKTTYCTIEGVPTSLSSNLYPNIKVIAYSAKLATWGWLKKQIGTVLAANAQSAYIAPSTGKQQTLTITVRTDSLLEDIKGDKEAYEDLFFGPDRKMLTGQEFDKMTKNGCDCCTGNVYRSEHDKLGWTYDKKPVCPDCINSNLVTNLLS